MGEVIGDRQMLQRADGSREDHKRAALFYRQPALPCEDLRCGVAESLADGELSALGIGRDVWRGCQPNSEVSWCGEFRVVATVGVSLAQETSGQREYEDQTLSGDSRCWLFGGNPQTGVVIWIRLNAFALLSIPSVRPQ